MTKNVSDLCEMDHYLLPEAADGVEVALVVAYLPLDGRQLTGQA